MSESNLRIENSRILIIDDHRNIRVSLKLALEAEGAKIDEAESVQAGLIKLGKLKDVVPATFPFHVVLLDIRMPDGSGLDILKQLHEVGLSSRVIMISGEGTVTEAFQATQMGAFDYIEKPFAPERILVSVGRCLEFNKIQLQNSELKKQALKGREILGTHESVQEMNQMIERVGPTNGRVLIHGETGTGKELVARAIHRCSNRAGNSLVKVNCAAIPHTLIESELFGHEKGAFTGAIKARRGLFEQADNGTIFLDEIGELGLEVQAKLLRVLQNGELTRLGSEKIINVDVRVLAATHRDLKEMVEAGEFREDLFYRLNVVTINVPPLRDRGKDIEILAENFLQQAIDEHSLGNLSFSPEALKQIRGYAWPGNVRELMNTIERIAILSSDEVISHIEDLDPEKKVQVSEAAQSEKASTDSSDPSQTEFFHFSTDIVSWQEMHTSLDRQYIKHVLIKANGNVSEAARMLCLERAYLHRLMKKLGVQRGVVVSD